MPLVPPRLDNRTFEQIVTEIRKRIPSFTPEWTDLNESDPGITLAQLFAFLSEQLLFQVNQVPDKGLVTFLKLVGAELHPASPATTDVTFSRFQGPPPATYYTPIDAGTDVRTAAPPPGEKTAVRFETTRDLQYLHGQLVEIVHIDCDGRVELFAAQNRAATGSFRPFGGATSLDDELYLVFDLDPPSTTLTPWPQGELTLRLNVAGSAAVGEPPPSDAPSQILWSYASGSHPVDGGRSLDFTDLTPSGDSTASFTRSGYLAFRFDAPDMLQRAPADAVVPTFRNRFVLRARVRELGVFGVTPPSLSSIRLNTVPARNLTTVKNERVGASTGLPFQRFRLANAPVFVGSVTLEVRPPGGAPETWTEVQDLFAARPGEKVFQLIPATGELLFGNGTFAAILPPDDGSVPGGNMVATYQYGGGRRGNVGARTLTRVGTVNADATNLLSAKGGDDEEPVSEGVTRAPAVIRSRFRAVSAADFEALARETPDVRIARALALPNTRPGLRPGLSTGAVTVVLVPNAPFEDSIHGPIPLPSSTAASVLAYLDQRRLVTTQVFVAGATFRQVTVDATLRSDRGASLAETRARALLEVQRYFHALVGGDEGVGFPFGGTVFYSRVTERLSSVEGVARVDRLRLRLDDADYQECADLPIAPGTLLYSGLHLVRVEAA